MNLPVLAIKNHQFTIIIVLILVLVGAITFITMPRSEDPQNEMAGATITVIYPGATPEDMEKLVVDHIEEAINELEDIKRLESTAFDGGAMIAVEFMSGSDPEDKYRKVIEKINAVEGDLPQDINDIDKRKFSVMDVTILQLAMVSDTADYHWMEARAKSLKKEIEKAYGIRNVEIMAVPEREVRITVDFERLAQLSIPISQLTASINSHNANIPGGTVDVGSKRFSILTSGTYEHLDEIRNTVIHNASGSTIRLKDVAEVDYDYADDRYLARFNGRRAIFINVTQKKGTNIYRIQREVVPRIKAFQSELPEGVELHTVVDQAESVRSRVGDFFSNFAQGILLVGIMILIIIGVRSAAVVMLAIPVSVLIGLTLLDLSGFGLQQMSIAGLIIALGLLVDNSIAVVENINRYLEMGDSKVEAAMSGAKEIGWALVSSTVTTVLAFIPMISIGGPTGDFIRSLAVVVVYTLIASLVIALSFTPYISSLILRLKENKKKRSSWIQRFIQHSYPRILHTTLRKPWMTVSLTIAVFAGAISLFGVIGVSFFPKAEKPQLIINVELPEGTALEKTNQVVHFVESVLHQQTEVRHYASNVGHGNPQVYYNIMPTSYAANKGQVFVVLKKYDRQQQERLMAEWRQIFDQYPGADIKIKEFIQGPPVEAPIAIKVIGNDLHMLKQVSRDVENIIAGHKGVINVKNDLRTGKTDLQVNINTQRAGLLGINIRDVDMAVRTNITGVVLGTYRDDEGDEFDMVVRMPFIRKPSIEDFEKIFVSSNAGAHVPLAQVADVEFRSSLKQVSHYNMDRQNTITADVFDLGAAAAITESIMQALDDFPFPRGFRYEVGGQKETQDESFGDMGQVLIVSLVGIFAVLVLQFRSFTQPLIIYSAIPLAVTGAFFALFITGHSFSFMAFVGLTSLVGIVVNDSILLVDYTNQLRRDGMELVAAITEAGKVRFMPIILTTVTTIGGLLPLTLRGGDMWAPMGWAIIGGLVFSTVLCLLIVPVLYKLYSTKNPV